MRTEREPIVAPQTKASLVLADQATGHGLLDLLLLVWLGCMLLLNLPGHLSLDSLVQIAEGQRGVFESWNPVFISIVFGQLTAWARNPGILVLISAITLILSVRAIVHSAGPVTRVAAAVVGVLLFMPVLLIYPAIVWKDVWFAHACLAAFALMCRIRSDDPMARSLVTRLLILSLLAFATLSRQTGILVSTVACVGMAALLPLWRLRRDWMTVTANSSLNILILLILSSLLTGLSQSAVERRAGAPVETGVLLLATYDIAGILHREPDSSLKRFEAAGVETAPIRKAALETYRADRIDWLQWPQSHAFVHMPRGQVYRQLLDLVWEHPTAYLGHRLEVYGWLLGLRQVDRCAPVYLGFEVGPLAQAAGIRQAPTTHAAGLYSYARRFFDSPLFMPAAWAVVSIAVLAIMLRRGWIMHPVAVMQAAGLAYLLSYAPVAIACDFRYTYFSTLSAHIGLIFVVARWNSERVQRRS